VSPDFGLHGARRSIPAAAWRALLSEHGPAFGLGKGETGRRRCSSAEGLNDGSDETIFQSRRSRPEMITG
jgi:hypothetical protein